MINTQNNAFFLGVVEDRNDPQRLGRARVRVLGIHTHDKTVLPTEDLPWAYKIQPTTSGAMSGIGHAPVGVVEGTWVAVQYIDPDKQMPFIIGTLGGIPQEKNPQLQTYEVNTTQTNVVSPTPPPPPPAPQDVQNSFPVRSAREFTTSESTISILKRRYPFSASPYRKEDGSYAIGYGSTDIGTVAVNQNTAPITQERADEILRERISSEFEAAVKTLRSPITQSMFDSCILLAYNVGSTTFLTTQVARSVNIGEYEDAAAAFDLYTTEEYNTTENRNLFLSQGVPSDNGTVGDTTQTTQQEVVNADPLNPARVTTTQSSRRNIEFFDPTVGFKDPNSVYPIESLISEPDTNRLARNEKIRDTIVYRKELGEHKGVKKANGKGTWNQSPTPYNAEYPFNNVWQSESGHVMEFDDTKGKERVHLYHKKGTFLEIDHNGTQVNRIIGDGYQIYERNGYVHVIGELNVTVDGAKTLKVDNTLDVEVLGATTINLHGNAKLNVANNLDITAGGTIKMKAGGNFAIDASRIDFNNGVASGLQTISSKSPNTSSLGSLQVQTRKDDVARNYESPDEGDATEQSNVLVEQGILTADELKAEPTIEEQATVEQNAVEETPVEETFAGNNTFDYNQLISKYYKLSDLTNGGTIKLAPQSGLTSDQLFNNLKALAVNVLDRIKERYPNVKINSGLRLGDSNSQHNKGQAVDVSFPGLTRAQLYDRVLEIQRLVPHDQLLLEYLTPGGNGWIHISFSQGRNRQQVFTMNNHRRVSQIGTFAKIA